MRSRMLIVSVCEMPQTSRLTTMIPAKRALAQLLCSDVLFAHYAEPVSR